MKGLGNFVQQFGAIPIPNERSGMRNFLDTIKTKIKKGYSITIFPEAHIWPYYTKIRPFKNVSFRYPIELNVPVFSITNTYVARGKNKDKIQRLAAYCRVSSDSEDQLHSHTCRKSVLGSGPAGSDST